MNAVFATHWELFIQNLINSGVYTSREEVLKVTEEEIQRARLKAELQKSIESGKAGRKFYDSDEFFEDIIRRGEERYNKRHNI